MPKQINIKIQQQPLDTTNLLAHMQATNSGNAGAFVFFIGAVRDFIDTSGQQQQALNLHLDYYPGMCEREIEVICSQALNNWPIHDILLRHRVGTIRLGEDIVFIGVASSHRGDAFRACEFIIDNLKTRAPFWKQEQLKSGNKVWVQQNHTDTTKTASWDLNHGE